MRKNQLLKQLHFILFTFLVSSSCFAQVTTAWVRRFDGPESGFDKAFSMAVDAAGNVYVTGESDGGVLRGNDFATIKYNAFGTEQWTRRYNRGPGRTSEGAGALVVDVAGNVYVTGYARVFRADYATIKYDADGNELWVRSYNGPGEGDDIANGIAVDALGNVYITGMSQQSPDPSAPFDYATVKYDADGNQLWVRNHPGGIPAGIVVDVSGNVYVTGTAGDDLVTIKYDTNGNELWLERFPGVHIYVIGNLLYKCIAVDASGNVYIAAHFHRVLLGENIDFMTIKYANDGTLLWAMSYNGPANADDHPDGLAVDEAGNVYVTGTENGLLLDSPSNFATIKYNSSGHELWIREYNGPARGTDRAASIALDESGNVFVAGSSQGIGTNSDYAVIKYNADGIPQWEERYNGPDIEGDDDPESEISSDQPTFLTVDARGNVYVTGISDGAGTHSDYATIKYAQPSPLLVAAGLDLTIFQGYGSLCVTLSAETSGGLPPYEYSWIPGQFTTQSIQVCPTKTISYAVTAMDAGKNKATDVVKVNVIDVRCGKNLDKVLVCHKGKKELCISKDEVKEHLAHGDILGKCKTPPVPSDNPSRPVITKLNLDPPSEFHVANYPNPVSSITRIQYEIPFNGRLSIKVYDVLGREVSTLINADKKVGYHNTDFNVSLFKNGLYYYRAILNGEKKNVTQSGKIIVAR